jgi:hypothetical protein
VAGRPISADETVALPELSLKDRIAVALALRGACRISEFIDAALEPLGPDVTDKDLVVALE